MKIDLLRFHHNDTKLHDHKYDTRFRKENKVLAAELSEKGIEFDIDFNPNSSIMTNKGKL